MGKKGKKKEMELLEREEKQNLNGKKRENICSRK